MASFEAQDRRIREEQRVSPKEWEGVRGVK
jgi:hypothetical protein